MFHKNGNRRRTWRERTLSLFLTAVLLLGSLPGLTLPAAAAHWADSYLDQLVDWGVMRADQISNPDTPLTRAEFMAIINRAYGYKEVGPMPFVDVSKSDWFYDDVAIAYNAGYMKGTSKTTAAPNARLTREQAVCILGRNMMLKETPGEDLAFVDSRSISGWARGMIKTAVNNYIVTGYPDDTFRPQANITKGQMAVLVTQCVGTPVNASGTYSLGDVSGNVTITAPNVTLRNTTISGDLYVSGGVGLGGVKLENVNVLGRIVVSGTGESENGAASVIMRNVTANELLVDNMCKKYVTVRVDGITEIANTIVRTNAYLEDNNTDDKGLLNITLEGKSGTRLDLAGRIKRVLDKTPNSFIQVAKGSVQSITVDEVATNSVIQINRNTEVKELNLDVATNVNGEGDIGKLNINAPGSTVTMLPDEIYIRPGITGNVNGVVMDSAAAEESSLDPRLLSGYPAANDVAPTSFRADFAGNKKGTVYWAVSSIADGSIGAEDLISPPSYGSKAVRGGSVGVPAGDTVGSTQISGLTVGGSYYLSAVLVDGRGERSPVKVISFTTPDNTVPAFAKGYPYMSLVSNTLAQVTVMPTKTCKLYYAVLPKGAPAPTASEMRSASVTGNLGYGIVDVVKNTERVINVSNRLQELKEYTLYLWLTDADGVNSSAVVPVQFKTVDKTAPEFDPDPDPSAAVEEETSVKLTAGLNEPGTIYWVAVSKGKAYPPVNPGSDPIYKDNIMSGSYDESGNLVDPNGGTPISSRLTSEYAKNQVKNHRGASIFGSVKVANADVEVNIDVKNLKQASAYDFYYVAQDTAGNFSQEVKKITIKTRDTVGPVVDLRFSEHRNGSPTVGSQIILRFNESISVGGSGDLLELFQATPDRAREMIKSNFILYWISGTDTPRVPSVTKDQEKEGESTWVDYSKVTVRASEEEAGAVEVVFDPDQGAIQMSSGTQYYFELRNVRDLTGNDPKGKTPDSPILILNPTNCKDTDHNLPIFETVFSWVNLDTHSDPPTPAPTKEGKEVKVDASFIMKPQSTQRANESTRYDLLVLAKGDLDYDLYYRVLDSKGNALNAEGKTYTELAMDEGYSLTETRAADEPKPDTNGWAYLGNKDSTKTDRKEWDGMSLAWDLNGAEKSGVFPGLRTLNENWQYEFAISVTKKDTLTNSGLWRGSVDFRAYVVASGGNALRYLASNTQLQPGDIEDFDQGVTATTGKSIGTYRTEDYVPFQASFGGTAVPKFTVGPTFTPGASSLKVEFTLEDKGSVYYVIAPEDGALDTEIKMNDKLGTDDNKFGGAAAGSTVKNSGPGADKKLLWNVIHAQTILSSPFELKYSVQNDKPSASNIVNGRYTDLRRGSFDYPTGGQPYSRTICLGGDANNIADYRLEPGKDYYIYMVVTDVTGRSSEVYIYNFSTGSAAKPKIDIRDEEDGRVTLNTRPGNDPAENVASTLAWRLFNTVDAKKILTSLGTVTIPTEIKGYGTSGTMSVLDALTTKYDAAKAYGGTVPTTPTPKYGTEYNNFSVFDVFADATLKFDLDDIIRSGSGGSINSGADVKTVGDLFRNTFTWFPGNGGQKGVGYIILVSGHNSIYDQDTSGGTIDDWSKVDSFAAREDIINRNMDAPQLEGTNSTQLSGGITAVAGNTTKTYTGSVAFKFDGDLYWKQAVNESTVYMVQPGNKAPAATTPSGGGTAVDTVGILHNLWRPGTGGTVTTTGTAGTTPQRNFQINFEGVPAGIYTLLPNGPISSAGGNEGSIGITIEIVDDTTTNNGATVHDIYITVTHGGKTQRTRSYNP